MVTRFFAYFRYASHCTDFGWPQKERKTWVLFPLVSKSGNRCDAVYLDIKRPRPSRNVNENSRRRILREEPNVNFIHGGKLLDGRAVNVALKDLIQRRAGRLEAKLHLSQDDFSLLFDRTGDDLTGFRVEGRESGDINHVTMAGHGRCRCLPSFQIGRYRLYPNDFSFHVVILL